MKNYEEFEKDLNKEYTNFRNFQWVMSIITFIVICLGGNWFLDIDPVILTLIGLGIYFITSIICAIVSCIQSSIRRGCNEVISELQVMLTLLVGQQNQLNAIDENPFETIDNLFSYCDKMTQEDTK